jgi:hypothetical protein
MAVARTNALTLTPLEQSATTIMIMIMVTDLLNDEDEQLRRPDP